MLSFRSALVVSSCLVACSTFSAADAPAGPDVPSDQADGGGGDASDPVVGTPVGCDPMEEPQKSPNCVVDAYGIFVDPTSGDDTRLGTKGAPARTIAGALTKLRGRKRIYLCEGTLDEHVKLRTAVNLFGGFACKTWIFTGKHVSVAPHDVGYALHLDEVPEPFVISDVDFMAAAGVEAAPSSIAVFASKSPSGTLRRSSLTAKTGAKGANGAAGAPGTLASSTPLANTINGTAPFALLPKKPGLGQTCTCSNGGVSKGGDGGSPAAGVGTTGKAGTPAQAVPSPAGADGAGTGGTNSANNVEGHRGSDAPAAENGSAADRAYDLTPEGLAPISAGDGSEGGPGQGGGGSGDYSLPGSSAAGSSGGCGGCGGRKGKGGVAGGGSIALVAYESGVRLENCVLSSADAGEGGQGGAGGGGGAGGAGGPAFMSQTVPGGAGGVGGAGGAGAGGAGGITAGVVYKGAKPNIQGTTTTGKLGAKGIGGIPGVNDGVDGVKADVFLIE